MAKRRPHISIWWDSDEYVCRFSFSYELVDFLRGLPKKDRRFDDEEKTWSFRARHLEAVLDECHRLGFDVNHQDGAGDVPTSTEPSSNDTLVNFFRLVPKEAMQAAYKRAAIALHPDRGGNSESMKKLNRLWSEIQHEFYGKA
jgi:hypothetical protein